MKTTFISLGIVLSIAIFALMMLSANSVENQDVNPSLSQPDSISPLPEMPLPVLKINGSDDSTAVYLQSLAIEVEVTGNIASTKYTMVFKNRTSRILEGELLFPLADGVTVSSYALDINGKMREAVPVEKAKATQVFEEIEQRRVDPGLLERVEGNNFRTRIYPVPANGTRTVSIGYEEELPVEQGAFRYRLPTAYKAPIEDFSIKATVWKSKVKPHINSSVEGLQFDRQGENFTASFARKNYQPERALVFSLPAPTEIPQVLMQSASGSYYFVASCVPVVETRKKQWSNQLGIIWDVSLSGLHRDIQRELNLLDEIIREKQNLSVSLYFLNNKLIKNGVYSIKNGHWQELRKALESAVYDGGTNFQAIRLKNISSGEFLFFSDGLSSLSDAGFTVSGDFKKTPVHCIVSSPKADYSAMKCIAAQTNGKFINLNILSAENLKNELFSESLHFLGIEANSSVREIYPSVATPVNRSFSVAGITDEKHTRLTLLFGYGNKVEKRIPVELNAKEALQNGVVHRIWAQKKINELDMNYDKNKAELTELGQQFGIVTRNTSLIVLETLQDYITYNITPPAELQTEFFRWRKGEDDRRISQEKDLLEQAVASAKVLQEWWKKDFKFVKPKYPVPDKEEPIFLESQAVVAEEDEMEAFTLEAISAADVSGQLEEVVMYAAERSSVDIADLQDHKVIVAEKSPTRPTQPIIKLMPPKQDQEYQTQLTGKPDEDYAIYLKLRPDYLNTPAFYFDMADWFFRHNDREKALRILTSIAEIDLENASLYRLLGYRLKEYKEYELEAYICKKVIAWRPMEAQSYRDYALALADNGQLQAALDSLYAVLTHSYSTNNNARSRGIEEVVVTEINQIIAKNGKLNISKIDHICPNNKLKTDIIFRN